MEQAILWIIGILVVGVIIAIVKDRKNHPNAKPSEIDNPQNVSQNEEPMPLYYVADTSDKTYGAVINLKPYYFMPELRPGMKEVDYYFSALNNEPLLYPKTKGAISKMSEQDRNAYYTAVESFRELIATGQIFINVFYQISIYQKHCATVLRKAIKNDDLNAARNAAMNLYYCIVCEAASFTNGSIGFWFRKNALLCKNLTYFNTGRITGKRGSIELEEYWGKYYQLISKALDPDNEVKKKTNYRKIQELVENLPTQQTIQF